jgi:hypothetical protein
MHASMNAPTGCSGSSDLLRLVPSTSPVLRRVGGRGCSAPGRWGCDRLPESGRGRCPALPSPGSSQTYVPVRHRQRPFWGEIPLSGIDQGAAHQAWSLPCCLDGCGLNLHGFVVSGSRSGSHTLSEWCGTRASVSSEGTGPFDAGVVYRNHPSSVPQRAS